MLELISFIPVVHESDAANATGVGRDRSEPGGASASAASSSGDRNGDEEEGASVRGEKEEAEGREEEDNHGKEVFYSRMEMENRVLRNRTQHHLQNCRNCDSGTHF